MNGELISYSQAVNQLGFAVRHLCVGASETKHIKRLVQASYNCWAGMLYDKAFLNWGFWDKAIHDEYSALDFDFSKLCAIQDIYSQILFYFLIRPLVKKQFFNKTLLDIGCGNGIALKASTQLLKTQYALGIDLVNTLVHHAQNNFYLENQINYLQSDAENLPLADESFDIITNLESSHLYPNPRYFFEEVERVLSWGGYFCYADIQVAEKRQAHTLDKFLAARPHLKVLLKLNITKFVQASIYQRLIVQEELDYKNASTFFNSEKEDFLMEFSSMAYAKGLIFLPWWKIKFKNPKLRFLAKEARNNTFWGKKYFFYYLIHKVNDEN